MNKELVSVIMPTYNAGKYLSDSIGSILAQTYENLELLITDDGSTEERTLQLLEEFSEKDPRVKVVYLRENLGSGHSRNNAIERAEGRYIAFCDCGLLRLRRPLDAREAGAADCLHAGEGLRAGQLVVPHLQRR